MNANIALAEILLDMSLDVESWAEKWLPLSLLDSKIFPPLKSHCLLRSPYLFCLYVDNIFGFWVLLPQRGSRRVFQERYHGLIVRREVKEGVKEWIRSRRQKKKSARKHKHYFHRCSKINYGKSKCKCQNEKKGKPLKWMRDWAQ